MDQPHVENVLVDTGRNVTYRVLAYRTLSEDELVQAVRFYLAHKKGKRPPRKNSTIAIMTIIGIRD